jgi:hypothetical protein
MVPNLQINAFILVLNNTLQHAANALSGLNIAVDL